MKLLFAALHEFASGTKPTCLYIRYSVATGWKADIIGSL